MKELIEFIAQSLVDDPDELRVVAHRSGPILQIDVSAAPGDTGRLIGRHGRTANAIRTVARVAATRQGLRVNVDID